MRGDLHERNRSHNQESNFKKFSYNWMAFSTKDVKWASSYVFFPQRELKARWKNQKQSYVVNSED